MHRKDEFLYKNTALLFPCPDEERNAFASGQDTESDEFGSESYSDDADEESSYEGNSLIDDEYDEDEIDFYTGSTRLFSLHLEYATEIQIISIAQGISDISSVVDGKNKSLLYFAASRGYDELVKYLLERKINITANENKHTALQVAAKNGHLTIVRMLVEYSIQNDIDIINQTDYANRSALIIAAAAGHIEIVEYLLNQGADPNIKSIIFNRTALRFAALHGYDHIVAKMLEFSLVRDAEDKMFIAALDCFFQQKSFPNHSNIDADSNGDTPLHHLLNSYETSDEVFQFILEVGHDAFLAMTKTYNNAGKLPINVLMEKKTLDVNKQVEKYAIYSVLILFMSKMEMLNQTDHNPEFDIAYEAIEYANSIIDQSSTSLNSNHLPVKQHDKLTSLVDLLRIYTLGKNVEDTCNVIQQYRVGNCEEFSWLVLKYFIEKGANFSAGIFDFSNNDHQFVIAGQHLNLDKKDPTRIIINADTKQVFYYDEREKYLPCYESYNISRYHEVNMATHLNLKYHVIKLSYPQYVWKPHKTHKPTNDALYSQGLFNGENNMTNDSERHQYNFSYYKGKK